MNRRARSYITVTAGQSLWFHDNRKTPGRYVTRREKSGVVGETREANERDPRPLDLFTTERYNK